MNFTTILKPLRRAHKPKVVPRPHGAREERTLSDIAEQQANRILREMTGGDVSWSPAQFNLAGIVLTASEEEVRVMLSHRVIARLAGRTDVSGDPHEGGDLVFSWAASPALNPDADLVKARLRAVAEMEEEISNLSAATVEAVRQNLTKSDSLMINLSDFSAAKSLPWPLEGWDLQSLALAEQVFVRKTQDALTSLGHSVKPNGQVLVVEREAFVPSMNS